MPAMIGSKGSIPPRILAALLVLFLIGGYSIFAAQQPLGSSSTALADGMWLEGAAKPPQEPVWPPIVAALEGEWEGRGTLFGNPAAFTMEWTQELGGRFLRLRFSNGLVADGTTSPIISALAFYRAEEDGRLGGHWFDTRGLILTLAATVEADRVITLWDAPSIENGRTTYRLVDPDTVEVIDEVQSDQGWREFGRATYQRRR